MPRIVLGLGSAGGGFHAFLEMGACVRILLLSVKGQSRSLVPLGEELGLGHRPYRACWAGGVLQHQWLYPASRIVRFPIMEHLHPLQSKSVTTASLGELHCVYLESVLQNWPIVSLLL